eukprot:c44520_g1_i1 orf=41-244(+)
MGMAPCTAFGPLVKFGEEMVKVLGGCFTPLVSPGCIGECSLVDMQVAHLLAHFHWHPACYLPPWESR